MLCTAPRIRTMASHPNPASLKDALADGLRKFEQQARQSGVANDQVIAARYVLCTFLDESAASTPWGGSGAWSAHSLLVQFHNEGWGGEKVFQLMSKLAENIPGNRALLELMYVVLALGFEGRYRVLDNGRMQLDSVRQRLAQMLAQARGSYDKALSPHWRGVPERGTRIRDGLPLWVIAMVSALVLALIYTGLRLGINGQSDPVFGVIQSLDVSSTAAPPPPLTNIPRRAWPPSSNRRSIRAWCWCRTWPTGPSSPSRAMAFSSPAAPTSTSVCSPAGPHCRGPQQRQGPGPDHGPHRQPAHPLDAVPVQLAPLARARQRGQDLLGHGGVVRSAAR